MIKNKLAWIIGIVVIVFFQSGFIWGKEKLSNALPKQWIGMEQEQLSGIEQYIKNNEIKLIKNEENIITDVFVKKNTVGVDGIKVGDSVEKILRVYPEKWVTSYPNYLLVLKGRDSSFGVATDYIIYLIEDTRVTEIQLGNTTVFSNMEIPTSNKEAEKLIQGTWISDHYNMMKFDNGHLENNLFEELYDYQQYRVVSPNKILISRVKGNTVDKIYLKFMTDGKTLYLFDTNELGIPIKETIERFILK